MCRRAMTIGNLLLALGVGLLLSLLVPRCFWTVVLAAAMIVLGWVIRQ